MKKQPYFIGISGGSASGKTYLLNHLLDRYSEDQITLISTDNYYIDRSQLPRDAEGEINFDHPSAIDLNRLLADLRKLSKGETVCIQEYTFNNPDLAPKTIVYRPCPLILVEGLFVFNKVEIKSMLDLSIFVDAKAHIRLSRRIRRDAAERGYGLDDVLDYYAKYVAPMYRKFIEPFKHDCDIIIPNNRSMEGAFAVLESHLDSFVK